MSHQNAPNLGTATLKRSIFVAWTLLLLLTCCAGAAQAASAETANETFPASLSPSGEFAATNTGETPSISADGRYVAFESAADNLGEQGPSGVAEAYVKDLDTGEVKLASRANGVDGEPANEPGEASGVESVIISGNGQYVIFTSDASNLVPGLPAAEEPGEHPWHVYRRDLQTGETALVDRVTGLEGQILDERGPRAEAISEEGRYVLFRDHVEDLEDPTGEHAMGQSTVYVRDMQTGTTTAVSRADGPDGELADEGSRAQSISPDGRYVAFESSATNLVGGMQANTFSQIYLRDLQDGATTLVSKTGASESMPAGEPGNASSEGAILVGSEGCEVAYTSTATNLYHFPGGQPPSPEVYITNLCVTPTSTVLVSRADGENGAPAQEGNAVIPTPLGAGADGRDILFSALSELTGETTNTSTHLYVRDLATGQTTLVDRASGAAGAPADSNPTGGVISANGCRVAFATQATNLIETEGLGGGQPTETYVRQLAPCQPPAEEASHEEASETAPDGEQPAGVEQQGDSTTNVARTAGSESLGSANKPATATADQLRLAIEGLSPKRLLLELTGPGRVTVRVTRSVGTARHPRWRTRETIDVPVAGAGLVRIRLPRLPAGRYRLTIHVGGAQNVIRSLRIR
jgi:hypothetical protein